MDIHRPKPWHGLREFLKEYGIIVLGVLTAIGLEQMVEQLHWRHVVHQHREALDSSVSDLYLAMLSRADMQDCVDRRLGDIATILARHDAGQPLSVVGPLGTPTASVADLGVFDMSLADQAFSHMPFEEQTGYFSKLGSYKVFVQVMTSEREVWRELGRLNHARALTAEDWSVVRANYEQAADLNALLKTDLTTQGSGTWLTPFKDTPKPKDYSLRALPRVKTLCSPMLGGAGR
ncbi:hypothetical protein [Phenylobacterium aquaticum]|uniref:hypothetical protein n=1 Tax=Phenylobacterium aquaticum TaxID=1763816 RepID=UPI001F5E0DC1|nr:hypothetical protein [Phenylobacterium aquaticum]MCI3132166.1 hypothetical protein [Phenylobacterium aquaticum]